MGPAKFRTIAFSGRPEDFPQWRMQFTALMETMDLRDILTGDSKRPDPDSDEDHDGDLANTCHCTLTSVL